VTTPSLGCVTEIVRVIKPSVLRIVMVPDRCAVPVLGVALILKEPLPLRFVGVICETVSQEVALLVGAFHVMLDVMLVVT